MIKKIKAIDREIQSVEYKKHQIEIKIANIKSDQTEKRKEIVKEKIKTLSVQERQILEQEFEVLLEKENNSMTEQFRNFRWKGMFISAYFDGFVEEKIYTELFKKRDEDNDKKVVQSSGLLELLDDVCHELVRVKQKKRNLECESKIFAFKTLENRIHESCSSQNLRYSNPHTGSVNPSMKVQNMLGGFVQDNSAWV